MGTEHFAQRLMQKMGGGVIGAQARTPVVIDRQDDGIADLDLALGHFGAVNEEALAFLLRIADCKFAVVTGDHAGVAHLATGFTVERRLVDDDLHLVAGSSAIDRDAVPNDRLDDAFGRFRVVAEEFSGAVLFLEFEPDGLGRLVAGTGPM